MATRKTLRGRGTAPRLAHNQEEGGSTPPPATDEGDTERPPPMAGGLVPLTDEQRQALALIDELTERMVSRGIRRVSMRGHFGADVELELDPAAQYINREPEPAEEQREKPAGECAVKSCRNPGGHLRQPFCRDHFHSELRNPRGNR
jgi:hypothetical protein